MGAPGPPSPSPPDHAASLAPTSRGWPPGQRAVGATAAGLRGRRRPLLAVSPGPGCEGPGRRSLPLILFGRGCLPGPTRHWDLWPTRAPGPLTAEEAARGLPRVSPSPVPTRPATRREGPGTRAPPGSLRAPQLPAPGARAPQPDRWTRRLLIFEDAPAAVGAAETRRHQMCLCSGLGGPGAGHAARLGVSGVPGWPAPRGSWHRALLFGRCCPALPPGTEWPSGLFIRTLWLPTRPQLTDRLRSGCVRAPSMPACGEQTSGSPALRHECAICCRLTTVPGTAGPAAHTAGRSRPLPSSFPSLGQILAFRYSPPFVHAQVSGDSFSPPSISPDFVCPSGPASGF